MINAYNVLKFLHVVSVIVWVGGVTGLSVVTWRLRDEKNREVLAALLRHGAIYGQRIAGPASILVLITGPVLVGIGHIGFRTAWVQWGFIGIFAHFLLGATLLRKRGTELARLASSGSADDSAILLASRRLWSAELIYLGILAVVVGVMVMKPSF